MPKTKKEASSSGSDSDSGPEDRNPPTKKTKVSSGGRTTDDEGNASWVLEKQRFVKVREFRGKVMVDIREYYDAGGDLKPGKKGISLSATQWKKLLSIVNEIDDAVKEKC